MRAKMKENEPMGYAVHVRQPLYPDRLFAWETYWTEVVGVQGEEIYLNDRAFYRDPPYGGAGFPPRRPAMVFATRDEAEAAVDIWLRRYRPDRAAVRIIEAA